MVDTLQCTFAWTPIQIFKCPFSISIDIFHVVLNLIALFWGQFHHYFMSSICASRFMLNLLEYSTECTTKKLGVTSSCVYWKMGKVLLVKLNETEEWLLAQKINCLLHLHFAPKGWWNWPLVLLFSIILSELNFCEICG